MNDKTLPNMSPLESDILKVLWSKKRSRVRDVYSSVKRRRKVALTSVAVLLDRLHKKGVVKRTIGKGRGGFYYVYYPVHDEESYKISVIERTTDQLIKAFGPVAVNYFNEKFSKRRGKK